MPKKIKTNHITAYTLQFNPNIKESWLPQLNFCKRDLDTIKSRDKLDDNHINAAMNILLKQYPTLFIQSPSLIQVEACVHVKQSKLYRMARTTEYYYHP